MDTLFNHPLVLMSVVGLPVFGIAAKMLGQSFARIAKWYLYIAVFAVVIVMDSIFFPFIGGKDWFFRFAIELSLIACILWWAFEAKDGEVAKLVREVFKRPLVIAASIFMLVVLLSSFFAYDFHAAFWSNYERGEGTFQMLHYFAFFLLAVALLKNEVDWKRIFGFSLVAAGVMIVYGLFANFGVATFIGPNGGGAVPGNWFAKILSYRFEGTLGNPAYVAPYLMFSIFFAAYLWLSNRKPSSPAARHWAYGLVIAVFLLFFIASQTRGAFIGLGVGIGVLLVYLAFSKSRLLRKWSLALIVVGLVLAGGGYAVRNLPAVSNIPEGRLLQLSFSDATAQSRFWVWGEAWQGFLERPILGWGEENFTAVYDKFFSPNFYIPGQQTETWFDRAHSVFFDYLSEIGILGLLAYLGIFVVFYVEFFKKTGRKANEGRDHETASVVERGLMVSLPVMYLVQGAAIFDVLPMYIPLFLFLAFSAYYFQNKNVNIKN